MCRSGLECRVLLDRSAAAAALRFVGLIVPFAAAAAVVAAAAGFLWSWKRFRRLVLEEVMLAVDSDLSAAAALGVLGAWS
jgi:hypothetical protein